MAQKSDYKIFGSFRFTLAVMVMLSHSLYFVPKLDKISALSLGNIGVFLFFVLSGFVITEALETFYKHKVDRFLFNRFMKIFPTYWFALIFTVIIILYTGELPRDKVTVSNIIGNFFLVGQYLNFSNYSVISVSWAVVIELLFYVSAGTIFFVIEMTNHKKLILILTVVTAISLYVVVHLTEGYNRFYGPSRFIPFFLLGCSFYYLHSHKNRNKQIFPVVILFGILSVHSFVQYLSASPTLNILGATILYLVLCILFAYLSNINVKSNFISIDKSLGDVTYFLYLIHMGVVSYIDYLHLDKGVYSFLMVQVFSILMAFAFYHYLERPFSGIRDRIRGCRLYG